MLLFLLSSIFDSIFSLEKDGILVGKGCGIDSLFLIENNKILVKMGMYYMEIEYNI